jgi:hypothetical protein
VLTLCLATLITDVTYLQNSIYHNVSAFCAYLQSPDPNPVNLTCPLDPGSHAFGVNIQLNDDYVFGTIVPMIQVLSSDIPPQEYICISFPLTPRLTPPLTVTFSIVPLAICLLVGFATLFAAIYNPWTGTKNLLRATSNFGQDPDALRLVTPGFSDCWYYVQFAVYTACLSLNYPGFYQPVLSRVAWSNLLFNTTLLHESNETLSWSTVTTSINGQFDNSTATLINIVNGSDYGLTQYAALVGIPAKDVWPTFMVWFLLVLCGITILTELAFGIHYLYKSARGQHTTDFGTNLCFLGGMILRIWQLFYIVLVTLCCYQLVVANESPTFAVGLSAIVLILFGMIAPAALIYILSKYAPREHLYADLHPLLVLGPLYNTYNEPKFLFAGCVFLIRLLQGIVVGAVQSSGIAQITLLAVLEIGFLCMINGWRPFHARTSMNGWHTFMSIIRLIIILFLVAFIPNISVSAGVRGWIGYTLLVIHAAVLIFVFIVNVIQTIVEISARMAGAGEDSARREREFGLGNVFGINQLMKRGNSTHRPTDIDYMEESPEQKQTTQQRLSRNSSQGGSSYGMLETGSYLSRGSSNTPGTTPLSPYTDRRNTMSPVSTHSGAYGYFPRNGPNNGDNPMSPTSPQPPQPAQVDPRMSAYYRQPRRSHQPTSPIGQPRFDTTTERETLDTAVRSAFIENIDDPRPSPTTPPRIGSPARPQSGNETKPRPNYAVREADAFYYRRPDYSQPLNPDPTARRLGTGPADPTGPLAIASTWLKGVFRGNPEKGKFEVVRGNAARATDIPLTENVKVGEDGSRPSSAGRGEDVRSPLVVDPNVRILEEENEDSIYEEDITSPGLRLPTTTTAVAGTMDTPSTIPTMDMGSRSLDLGKRPLPLNFPVVLNSDTDDDEYPLPLPPAKNPNRGSVSSMEDIAGASGSILPPPSIPRKSSARHSPRVPSELPWGQEELVRQVKTGRGVWTEQDEGSKESVGQVRDSADWSDEE